MKIGELAKLSGVNASTIRFYEQKGLLPAPKRTASGYRAYNADALQRIHLIRFSQRLGFKLDELPQLISKESDWDHQQIMARLVQKRNDTDALIAQLQEQRQTLALLIDKLERHWDAGQCMPEHELAGLIKEAKV